MLGRLLTYRWLNWAYFYDCFYHQVFKRKTWIPCCLVIAGLYYYLSQMSYAWYVSAKGQPCHRNLSELKENVRRTHVALLQLNLTHFLIYGSLWGGLRYEDPLPWDNDYDLGLLYNEILGTSEQNIINTFKKSGLNITYFNRFGLYRVTYKKSRGDLMLFKNFHNNGWLERTGWESYLFFLQYRNYHRFPAYLVSNPETLPTVNFAGCRIGVPREGIEIQKYHYPDDWWKEMKPLEC